MPRDLDGPIRDKRRERAAPSGRNAVRPANTRDIDTSSVRETISRSRLQGVETEADGGSDPYGLDAEPRRDAPARSQNRRTDVHGDDRRVACHYDGGEDIRRVFDEQRHEGRHSRTQAPQVGAREWQTGSGSRQAEDVRSRDTRDASSAAKKQQRLHFTKEDEPPSPAPTVSEKAAAARRRADKADVKLERARENLPKTHHIRVEKTFDEQKKKTKRRLVFEEEIKSKRAHMKGSPVARPVKAGANAAILHAHKKVHEVEHENVGVEAGHKTELAAEGGLRMASRRRKTAPYRKAARLERKATLMNVKAAYQQALSENPKAKKSLLSRAMQKRKIKRQYAKAANEARKAAKRAKKGGSVVTSALRSIGGFIKRHPIAFLVILLIVLLIILIVTIVSSLTNIAVDGAGAVLATSYLSEDRDIDNAELIYTEWETDLLLEAYGAEGRYPGYDEYRYSVDDVGHGAYELMAYLTARYQSFTYAGIQAELRAIFDEQYSLTFTEEIETRYNDPDDVNEDGDLEPYKWKILHVTLTARSFTDVVGPKTNVEQVQHYELLMRVKGNRQYSGSPFSFNWLPYVSDGYGYRVHPIHGGKDYHKAVDIAVGQGTEILAGHDGTVISAGDNGGYGLVVVLEGEDGLVTKYAHCSQLLVSSGQAVKMGDIIAKVGSTGDSTGPHLHFEVIKNGQYLNPLYFAITNDDGSSYIPPGSPGGVDIPDYPGAPMGNGSYAALMEEAQKHLGKPYVFGAKGPNSFDCSGFVCWSLSKSGVYQIATNAQGLYNACTPVSRANAQPGDLIFFTGTYNAGRPVTHVGIYIGNGQMIHAGKPVQYASIDTRYWTEHFYAFGRLPI